MTHRRGVQDHRRRGTVPSTTRDRLPCRSKRRYPSRKVALSARDRVRRRGERVDAYHCVGERGCHGWHLGHPPGTRREGVGG